MRRQIHRIVYNSILVFAFLMLASGLLALEVENLFVNYFLKCLVFSIYFGLVVYWGISIMKRIMNIRVRKYMMASAFTLLIWLVDRTVKWYICPDSLANRYCWYMYYVIMILLAYFAFMASECIVVKDVDKLRKERIMAFVPTVLFALFVLTNEYHQIVFRVNPETGVATRYIGYGLIVFWLVELIFLSLFRLPKSKDEKLLRSRILVPYIVVLACILYCIVVALYDVFGRKIFIEYTAGYTMFVIAFWESLIQTGLIPFNTDYDWCFNHSEVRAQILDAEGNSIYRSIEGRALSTQEIEVLTKEYYFKPAKDTELICAPIKGGYVVWEKDIHEINRLIEQLNETQKSVKEVADTLEENIAVEKKRKIIEDRNTYYDLTFNRVADRVADLTRMIEEAKHLEGDALITAIRSIDIQGVYVKRKSNLILLSQQSLKDFTGELKLCFKESFDNMNDAGIEGGFIFRNVSCIDCETALKLYASFEIAVERYVASLESINMIVAPAEDGFNLMVNLTESSHEDKSELIESIAFRLGIMCKSEYSTEDMTVTFFVKKGGAEYGI